MAVEERLPNDAVVIRCGLPPFTARPLLGACGDHPDGVFGFSVQSAAGLTVAQLATACRNKYVGYTTWEKSVAWAMMSSEPAKIPPRDRRGSKGLVYRGG